jgi:hypothetical protein
VELLRLEGDRDCAGGVELEGGCQVDVIISENLQSPSPCPYTQT